jgi:TM2 domain-containing membrane protein YozV
MNCEFCDSPLQPGVPNCPGCGAAQSVVPPAHPYPSAHSPVHAAATVPHAPTPHQHFGPPKSRLAAGLLAIFLAGLGIHNFYLGYTSKGLTQLLISVLSCGYLWIFMAIWEFIEGIRVLIGSVNTDATGRPLE